MSHPDSRESWPQIIKGRLESIDLSGDHFEIIQQPYAETLAGELAKALARAQAKADARAPDPAATLETPKTRSAALTDTKTL